MSRRVLIVSPHFPPVNAPDHQRVRMSLGHYREFGWQPAVLAVDAQDVPPPRDELLAASLPDDVAVIRVRAYPLKWMSRLGVGNLGYRAWRQLDRAGSEWLQAERFDLVYFSTTQFVATTLGRRWRQRFGVPFVIDVQDPWRTDYYERPGAPKPPGGWKYRIARWQADRLEERAWRDAAGFISVSDDYLKQLRGRYSWFAGKPAAVIPFGASESDFLVANERAEVHPAFTRRPDTLHFVNVGAVGTVMRPALETLFSGLAQLRKESPERAAQFRLHFIGTSYAPAGRAEPSVLPVARQHGVEDLVDEQTSRVGYFTALKTMLAADALILPGSSDAGYSPSKVAGCFLARRPVLAVVPAGSAAAARVAELKFATVADTTEAGAREVAAYFRTFPAAVARRAPQAEARFAAEHSARAAAQKECALFDLALTA